MVYHQWVIYSHTYVVSMMLMTIIPSSITPDKETSNRVFLMTRVNNHKAPPLISCFINPLAIVTLNRNSNVHQVRSASSLSYLGGSITKKTSHNHTIESKKNDNVTKNPMKFHKQPIRQFKKKKT